MSLQEYRRRAFLTLDELAEKAGVTKVTVWRIEHGKYQRLAMQTMRKIAGALDVPPDNIREFAAEVRKQP